MTMAMTQSDIPPGPESADQRLAEGFAHHVERWALAQGATEHVATAVRHAASALSMATSNGHACMALQDLPHLPHLKHGPDGLADVPAWRRALLTSGVVGCVLGCELVQQPARTRRPRAFIRRVVQTRARPLRSGP